VPSNTTRAIRPNENPKTTYYRHNVSVREINHWQKEGDLAWRESFGGNEYASRHSELKLAFGSKKLWIIILVPDGIKRFEEVADGVDKMYVYIHPKPEGERVALMVDRGDRVTDILKRKGEAAVFWKKTKRAGVPFQQVWNLSDIPALIRQLDGLIEVRWPKLLPVELHPQK